MVSFMGEINDYVDLDAHLLESSSQLDCSRGDIVEVEYDSSPFENCFLHIQVNRIDARTVFGVIAVTPGVIDPSLPILQKVCFSLSKVRAKR
jgi:hypothetical protein